MEDRDSNSLRGSFVHFLQEPPSPPGVAEAVQLRKNSMKKEHLSTDEKPKSAEDKLDKQLQDSFPTSDPPSFSPGAVGAPKRKTKDNGAAAPGHAEKKPHR